MITTKKDLFIKLSNDEGNFDFNTVDIELLKEKDIIIGIISKNGKYLKAINESLIDSELASIAIQKSLYNFEYLPEKYRSDSTFIKTIPFESSSELCILKFANDNVLSDKEFICNLLHKFKKDKIYKSPTLHETFDNDNLYFYLNQKLKKDKDVINAAKAISPIIFKDTPKEYRQDISFCESFIYDYFPNIEFAGESVKSQFIKSNHELIKNLCTKRGNLIMYVKDHYENNKEIAELTVSNFGEALQYFSNEVRGDLEIVKLALKENPMALRFASDNLKDNKEVVVFALELDGYSLEYASERLKDDNEIVTKAINYKRTEEWNWGDIQKKSSGGAFKFASERVRSIKELAILALQNEGDYSQDGWSNFDHQSEKPLFAYLPESISNDKDIVINAIKNNLACVKYISPSIRDEEDIKKLIKKHKEQEKENNKTKTDGWG